MLTLLLACTAPKSADTGTADTGDTVDTADGDTADTDTGDPCLSAEPLTGALEGGWSGDVVLFLSDGRAGWSDRCYGGYVDPPFDVVDGRFDWSGRIYLSADGPEPRAIRATGCATRTRMTLSIVEVDGTPWQGPWSLTANPEIDGLTLCD